jgi:hypothetical protein
MIICVFVTGILSIVPLIDGRALRWDQIGFIFMVSSLFSLSHAIVEFVRPIPSETTRAVDSVVRAFERRLRDVQPQPSLWTSGPYPVRPPAQQIPYQEKTEQMPTVNYPLNTWFPSDKPTAAMPAITQVPQTSQQIIRLPHHF